MERSSAAFSEPLKLGILPQTGLGERQATGHKEFIRMGESLALRGGVAHYYITGIRLMLLNPAYGIYVPLTVYYFKTEPTGLLSINGSIIVGGYLSEYDFHNDTVVTISPINYGQPINACIVPINNT